MLEQARRDGGKTGSDDPFVVFYHDVPRALAEEALSKERSESQTAYQARGGSFSERLAITPDEIAAGHCVALSRPTELGDMLVGYAATR